MRLPGPPLPQSNLRPGELLVTQEPRWVITLLGSCVAVTMFSRRFNLAAICHGMLPRPHKDAIAGAPDLQRFRFLSQVIPEMVARFRVAGLEANDIEVKLFGGGNVIDMGGDAHEDRWIGTANVTAARLLLRHARLTVRAEDVGGDCGRKIVFNTQSGEVLHKLLSCGSAKPSKGARALLNTNHHA